MRPLHGTGCKPRIARCARTEGSKSVIELTWKFCQRVELLEVYGDKQYTWDQGTSGAHGQHMRQFRTFPSHLRAEGSRIFLTAPLSRSQLASPSSQGKGSCVAENSQSAPRV